MAVRIWPASSYTMVGPSVVRSPNDALLRMYWSMPETRMDEQEVSMHQGVGITATVDHKYHVQLYGVAKDKLYRDTKDESKALDSFVSTVLALLSACFP